MLAGGSIALLWRPDLRRFFDGIWAGTLGFCLFLAAGGVLGRLVGGWLFRPASGGPPDS
jgi:hypothetical protein